jgi:hypothetical protein
MTMSRGYDVVKPSRKPLVPFRTDAVLERLIEDVAEGRITPTPETRMSLGFYQSAKAAARAAGKGDRS